MNRHWSIHLPRFLVYGVLMSVCGHWLLQAYQYEEPFSVLTLIFGSMASLLMYHEYRVMITFSKLPPSEIGLPLFGMLFSALGNMNGTLKRLNQKYGTPFALHFVAGSPLVVFSSEEDLAWIWSLERKGHAEILPLPSMVALLGKEAVFCATGRRHRILRRIMEPIFAPTSVKQYTRMLDKCVLEQLELWEGEGMWHSTAVFKTLTLRLLLIIIFDDVTEETISYLHDHFKDWLRGFFAAPIPYPGGEFSKALKARQKIVDKVKELIDDFRAKNGTSNSYQDPNVASSFLGRLLEGKDENGNSLTENDLIANIVNIIFAGHDTTFTSIGTFLHYLHKLSPKLRSAMIHEVKTCVREPLDSDNLKNDLPILNAFLAEAWRHEPPVLVGSKRAKIPLEYKGYKIPKDSTIFYTTCFAEKESFGDNDFYLERWLPKDHHLATEPERCTSVDYNQIGSKSFRVFGGGNHACLGHYFAKLEARIIMVRLLHRYEVNVRNSEFMENPFSFWMNEFQINRL